MKKSGLLAALFFVMRFSVVPALAVAALTVSVLVPEVEEVEEIAKCRTVERHVGIIVVDFGIREIVPAAVG